MKRIKRLMATYPKIQIQSRDAEKLRGFFASQDRADIRLHNHIGKNYVYEYPLVQYKVLHKTPFVLGIEDGIQSIYPKIMGSDTICIADKIFSAESLTMTIDTAYIGDSKLMKEYAFVTPWLCLNQKNYKTYMEITPVEKKVLLERILIGNLLSMAKSFQITVEETLEVETSLKEIPVYFKGEKMMGFIGSFSVNYQIPNYFGLGKSDAVQ